MIQDDEETKQERQETTEVVEARAFDNVVSDLLKPFGLKEHGKRSHDKEKAKELREKEGEIHKGGVKIYLVSLYYSMQRSGLKKMAEYASLCIINPMQSSMKTIIFALIAGLVGGFIGATILRPSTTPVPGIAQELTDEERIKDFYLTETAVLVSPHGLRKKMAKGDTSFILVDLRSPEEYEREHIVGAINIPAYKDPNTSAYGDVERIVQSFRDLGTDKDVIAYCYSIPCMTGRKVGKMLAEHDIYVKELGVGWNEWRHFWTLWNHEHEWDLTNVEDYIATGPEPGQYAGPVNIQPCTIEGEFGC